MPAFHIVHDAVLRTRELAFSPPLCAVENKKRQRASMKQSIRAIIAEMYFDELSLRVD